MDLGNCLVSGANPLLLHIANNPVSVGGSASTRGIAATIGANNQFFSLLPTFEANNTKIVIVNTCANAATNYSCIAQYGGLYTPTTTAYQTNNLASWNGTPGAEVDTISQPDEKLLFFNDVMKIAGNDLLGLPFFSAASLTNDYVAPSSIPLGTNSTFIQALLNIGAVPTYLWSIWPGNRYRNLDGLLIIGGYDQNRTVGDLTPINLDRDKITGLVWQHADNTTTNLMPKSTTELWFIFEPANDFLILPAESSSLFRKTLGGMIMDDGSNDNFAYKSIPTGKLVVTLSNGNKTSIPATDLFANPEYYNDQGRLTVANASIFTDKISTNTDNSSMGVWLGEPFLTHHLLVVDAPNYVFYLADAAQDNLGNGAQNLQYLCYDNSAELARAHKRKIGGITGGVVGGIIVLVIVAFFVFRCRRRRQGKRVARGIPEIVLRMRSKKGNINEKNTHSYDVTDKTELVQDSPDNLQPVPNLPEVAHLIPKSPQTTPSPSHDPEVVGTPKRPVNGPDITSHKIAVEDVQEVHADERHEMMGDIKTKVNSGPFELPSDRSEKM